VNFSGRKVRATPRPIAAGLLIALTAPLFGLFPILAWFALGLGDFSLGYLNVQSIIFGTYFFGGIQSVIAGTLVALAIWRLSWVSAQYWTALTAILGLAPVALFLLNGGAEPSRSSIVYVADSSVAFYFIVAALFASLVLRVLIIALGWMRR
jgi:hypothetical protein